MLYNHNKNIIVVKVFYGFFYFPRVHSQEINFQKKLYKLYKFLLSLTITNHISLVNSLFLCFQDLQSCFCSHPLSANVHVFRAQRGSTSFIFFFITNLLKIQAFAIFFPFWLQWRNFPSSYPGLILLQGLSITQLSIFSVP